VSVATFDDFWGYCIFDHSCYSILDGLLLRQFQIINNTLSSFFINLLLNDGGKPGDTKSNIKNKIITQNLLF